MKLKGGSESELIQGGDSIMSLRERGGEGR